MAQFKMTFSGLCAFAAVKDVNEQDSDVQNDASEVVVFLVNSNHEDVTLLRREKRTHSPLLGFDWKIAVTGKVDDGVRGSWELFGEVVRLEIRRKDGQERPPQRVVLKGGDIKAPHSEPQQGEKENIWWIPRMGDVLPDADVLRDDAFDFPQSGPDEDIDAKWPVVARIHLSGGGSLVTAETGEYKGSRVLASFVPGPPPDADPLTQVIAHEAQFVIDLDPEEVLVLTATNEGGNPLDPSVRSFEFPGDSSEGHEVNVSNLCFYYRDGQYPSEDPPTADEDFTYFYLLSDKFGDSKALPKDYTKLPTPVPVRYEIRVNPPPPPPNSTVTGGGADPIRCTMTRLSSVDKEKFELQTENISAPRVAKDSPPMPGALGPLTDFTTLLQNPSTPAADIHLDRNDIREFAIKDQDRDFWCWAAVAQYVRHVQDGVDEELCVLAGAILNSNKVGGGKLKCCEDRGSCDLQFNLDLALAFRDNLSGKAISNKLKFAEVQKQIGENPIACGLSRSDKSKHAVVIRGWGKIKGKYHFFIADPDGPRPRMWPVADLEKAKECAWTFTCLTKKGGK